MVMDPWILVLPPLAIALLLGHVLGHGASRIGLPQVTVYLLMGIALGPHGLAALDGAPAWSRVFTLGAEDHGPLKVLEHIAIGFILYRVGTEFRFADLRRIGPRIVVLSMSEVLLTGGLVFLAVWSVTGNLLVASIAPVLATSSAPSATLLTLREVEAEGRASRAILLMVGINNLVTLLVFPIPLALLYGVGDPKTATLVALAAFGIGAVVGLVISIVLESAGRIRYRTLLGVIGVLACVGLVGVLPGDPVGLAMLACFGAGLAVANSSPHAEELTLDLERAVYPLYALFFVAAGSDLDVRSLGHMGALGVAFIGARIAGKVLGSIIGMRLGGFGRDLPPYLGMGLLCQAGVALGILAALEGVGGGEDLRSLTSVVLASVVFFELVGPWLTRRTVIQAGEVKLANLVFQRPGAGGLREVRDELLRNLGADAVGRIQADAGLSVRHAMHRAPDVARSTLGFDAVLKLFAESGHDTITVVGAGFKPIGMIAFSDIQDILYDPSLRNLVIAEDLMQPLSLSVSPELALSEALQLMDDAHVHSVAVIEGERLAGLLTRRDVYSTLHRAFAHIDAESKEEKT
jgi:Kef-type K+ transport system membrane component KefB/CBS domain-containing protein